MTVFFDKSELVIIILILLLFDMNSFFEASTNFIVHKNNISIFEMLFLTCIILFDFYIYKSVIKMKSISDTTYSVKDESKLSCPEYVDTISRDNQKEINNLEKKCKEDKNDIFHNISYKTVSFYTLFVIVVVYILTLFYGKNVSDARSIKERILYGIPSIITGMVILLYSFF